MLLQIKTILLTFTGHALIFVGVTFLSGQLLPQTLSPVYKNVPRWAQILAFAIIISIPANLLIARAYQVTSATFTSVVYIVAVVLGAITVGVLIEGAKINLNVILATLLMLVASVWLTIALKK